MKTKQFVFAFVNYYGYLRNSFMFGFQFVMFYFIYTKKFSVIASPTVDKFKN